MDRPAAAIRRLRDAMPALANAHKVYLNYGGQGPLPQPSLHAMVRAWTRIQELGPFSGDAFPYREQLITGLREALASLCAIPVRRLAFTENVTGGCILPLWGLPWREGDQLLVSNCEHPGVIAACQELAQRQRLEFATFAVHDCCEPAATLQRLDGALRPNTRLVVLSHLLWNTGAVMPVAAVGQVLTAHPQQPWLLVDGAQSVGCLPLADAVSAADIYAFTGHKWLCGPEGLGAVVVSDRLLDVGAPTLMGWRGLSGQGHPAGRSWRGDARRYEVATSCYPLMAGLLQSLQCLNGVGDVAARLQTIRANTRHLWHRLQEQEKVETLLPQPPEAGLVSFKVRGNDPAAVAKTLGRQGIWLRSFDAPSCLRACCHVTTLDTDIERLLHGLAAVTRA